MKLFHMHNLYQLIISPCKVTAPPDNADTNPCTDSLHPFDLSTGWSDVADCFCLPKRS